MRLTPFSRSGVYGTYLKVPSGIFSPTLIDIVKLVSGSLRWRKEERSRTGCFLNPPV